MGSSIYERLDGIYCTYAELPPLKNLFSATIFSKRMSCRSLASNFYITSFLLNFNPLWYTLSNFDQHSRNVEPKFKISLIEPILCMAKKGNNLNTHTFTLFSLKGPRRCRVVEAECKYPPGLSSNKFWGQAPLKSCGCRFFLAIRGGPKEKSQ